MKGISDNAQAMIDNFRKEGSREFSMDDFEDLIDAGDTDEKMFLAEKLVKKDKVKKSIHYSIFECDKRFEDQQKVFDNAVEVDEDMSLRAVVDKRTIYKQVHEWLEANEQQDKDNEARKALEPLQEWYERNKANRKKRVAADKIGELIKNIEEFEEALEGATKSSMKKLLEQKIAHDKKDLEKRKKKFTTDFYETYETFKGLVASPLRRQSTIDALDEQEKKLQEQIAAIQNRKRLSARKRKKSDDDDEEESSDDDDDSEQDDDSEESYQSDNNYDGPITGPKTITKKGPKKKKKIKKKNIISLFNSKPDTEDDKKIEEV